MAARRYQPRPYRPRPTYSRRPAGSWPQYRQRPYRRAPRWSLFDLLFGRRR
jgi:hypothetical protein